MKYLKTILIIGLALIVSPIFGQKDHPTPGQLKDFRYIENGLLIHSNGYVDQPYVSILDDGSWFCIYTTSAGHEGAKGEHIACCVSKDQGKTWSDAVQIEEPSTESSSYGVPYVTPYGRIYVFYNYNGDKIHECPGFPRKNIREDMLGWYCFKYSDDKGKTWSERYRIPMRQTAVDVMNQWKGDVQIFWGIDKPIKVKKGIMFAFSKIGEYMLEYSDGWVNYCKNIDKEKNPEKLQWTMLPEGDYGIRNVKWGDIQEEHNLGILSDGTLCDVLRSTQGYVLEAYSYDNGKTWTKPEPCQDYLGRDLKNPRANAKIWKCSNGKYLLWYHNNATCSFYNRVPAWLCGGVEKDGKIVWSQPEIFLYQNTLYPGPSYPDIIEQDGKYWISETQKTEARIHEIPVGYMEALWNQFDISKPVTRNLKINLEGEELAKTDKVALPAMEGTREGKGFTVTVRLHSNLDMVNGNVLVDTRDENGKGFWMEAAADNSVKFSISDGENTTTLLSDTGVLKVRSRCPQEVTVVVDYGPRVIQFITDGVVNDGQNEAFGWGRLNDKIESVATGELRINKPRKTITGVKFYDTPLMNTEVISDYRNWKNLVGDFEYSNKKL